MFAHVFSSHAIPEPMLLASLGAALLLLGSLLSWRKRQNRPKSALKPNGVEALYGRVGSKSNPMPVSWDGPFESQKTTHSWPTKSDVNSSLTAH
jgi:LPXTG-motif cell wall-anchored protein